jgi:hypothetical protein
MRHLGRLMAAVAAFELSNVAATLLILRATQLLTPAHGAGAATSIALGLYAACNAAATLISIPAGRASDHLGCSTYKPVHVNTLMLQDVLADPEWEDVLTPEDRRGLTPLFESHVLPYGEVKLNMNSRLTLGGSCSRAVRERTIPLAAAGVYLVEGAARRTGRSRSTYTEKGKSIAMSIPPLCAPCSRPPSTARRTCA